MNIELSPLSVFVTGFLTSLTPCVYPMIPISLGYLGSRKDGIRKTSVLLFGLGQILTFASLGLIAVQLGDIFGSLSEDPRIQIGVGLLMFAFAYFAWKGLPKFFDRFNTSVDHLQPTPKKSTWYGPLIAGSISALVASPCSTPILGAVLLLISQSESQIEGFGWMAIYGLGKSMIFLTLGLGFVGLKKLPKSGPWMKAVHHFSIVLMVGAGVYFMGRGFQFWT